VVGRDQDILLEKYADDFSELQPQTIMSISKMYLNLFVGELVEKKKLDLSKKISFIYQILALAMPMQLFKIY
jgi:CubicO group peptidase (beta-lactamase class C family)